VGFRKNNSVPYRRRPKGSVGPGRRRGKSTLQQEGKNPLEKKFFGLAICTSYAERRGGRAGFRGKNRVKSVAGRQRNIIAPIVKPRSPAVEGERDSFKRKPFQFILRKSLSGREGGGFGGLGGSSTCP